VRHVQTRTIRRALAVLGVLVGATAGAACGPPPPDFVVNSTGDTGDASLNGTCATSGGSCTLRAAMQEANATAGHQIIGFAIAGSGPHRIQPATTLPILTDAAGATIDGYRQEGSALNTSATASNAVIKIELKGKGPTSIDGIKLQSPDNVIQGLAIWDFRLQVHLFHASADRNEVIGNFIGTDAAGTAGAPARNTSSQGVNIQNGASGNLIGKSGNANRNVISGNYGNGVGMYNVGTEDNLVQNNLIGLRPTGTAGLTNHNHGVDINVGAADNLVGGTSTALRNVISGNGASGVEISHDPRTLNNDVIGNFIGTAASGTSAPASARNADYGVYLEGVASCDSSCPADAGESTVRDNVIVNSADGGVAVQKGRHDDVITDNRIGVLDNGTAATNNQYGVRVEKGSHRTIVGPDNVISGNGSGVQIQATGSNPGSSTEVRTYSNTITRNEIFANTGLGIDLAPLGSVTANPGAKVNDSVDIPTHTSQTSTAVTLGTCPNCRIELFLADSAAGQNGEGQEFLDSATANGAGTAVVPVDDRSQGEVVTATATDTIGNTSEFSQNVLVPSN